MPVGILDMALRIEQDPTEGALRQNTGHMTKDTGQAEVKEIPVGSVGYQDTNYDYSSIRWRRGPDVWACDQFYTRVWPSFYDCAKDLALMEILTTFV